MNAKPFSTLILLVTMLCGSFAARAQVTIDANTYAIATSQGTLYIELRPDAAPATVANFLAYVSSGAYTNSLFHRLVPGFVLQGGGYYLSNGTIDRIPEKAAVKNEFKLSNIQGTVAMTFSAGDPNGATDEFFFNLVDNSATLDSQKFTVFAQIVDPEGYATAGTSLAVLTTIAKDQLLNESASYGNDFSALPVNNYIAADGLLPANLVTVASITQVQTLTLPVPTLSSAAAAVTSGKSAEVTVTGTGFTAGQPVTFGCSSLPTHATCTFNPAMTVADSSGSVTSTVTIATGVNALAVRRAALASLSPFLSTQNLPAVGALVAAALLFLPFAARRRGRHLRPGLLLITALFAIATTLTGCGGASKGPSVNTPAGTYTVAITETGGSRSASANFTLTVQ